MEKDLPTIGSLPVGVRAALADIQRLARLAEAAIAASGVTPEEFDRLADEVCDEVRRGPQS